MALDRRWPLALARSAVPVALGLLLWVAIAGGEPERQQTLKVQGEGGGGDASGTGPGADPRGSPVWQGRHGADAASLEHRRRHNELIMAALREAAETDDNVAHRGVPWRK